MSKFQLGEPKLHKYHGVTYTDHITPAVLDRIRKHSWDPSDIIVASCPKSGTTWVHTLVSLILSNGQVADTPITLLELHRSNQTVSNFDLEAGKPPPRQLFTHLQFRFLEEGFRTSRPKVIYVMRNPFDQMVSFYHFCKMNMGLGLYTGTWDEFYNDLYKQDKLCFGDYFDHVTGWWDAQETHSDHVMYVKYEDMIKDPRDALLKMIAFLGKTLSDDVIEGILEQTTFDSMKNNPKVNKDTQGHLKNDIVPFMRKGKVGDWRNFFSDQQQEEIEKMYNDKIVFRGLEFDLG